MAFFKLRKAAGDSPAQAPAPESVDAMRRRARYRLAGAAMLVLAAVVGFPLLFDNQPRPIAVDIPIDIPDKTKVKPLPNTPVSAGKQAEAVGQVVPAAEPAKESKAPAAEPPKEEVVIAASTPKTEPKPEPKPADTPVSKPAEKATEAAAATGRFVVQFGAFTESARAQEARAKVERAGLKTYAQVIEGPQGKKYRVRVGPFEKRSDAEKAAEKIKKLDLPAAILAL